MPQRFGAAGAGDAGIPPAWLNTAWKSLCEGAVPAAPSLQLFLQLNDCCAVPAALFLKDNPGRAILQVPLPFQRRSLQALHGDEPQKAELILRCSEVALFGKRYQRRQPACTRKGVVLKCTAQLNKVLDIHLASPHTG